MATVPGILFLSGYQGQGGLPPLLPTTPFNSDLQFWNDRELHRFVPQNDDGTQLDTYHPHYDGSASATYYAVDEAGSDATHIKVTPSPGWTPSDPNIIGRLASLVNFTAIAVGLLPTRVYVITGNTADTLTVTGSTVSFGGLTDFKVRIGTGLMTAYHPVPGYVTTTGPTPHGGGSSWQAGGQGVGADARIVPEIARRIYDEAPHFYFAKLCFPTSLAVGWAVAGASRASTLAELARISAAAALEGNTIRWELAIIDVTDGDLKEIADSGDPASLQVSHVVNHQSNMIALINWLRGGTVLNNVSAPYSFASNANINIQITNHHPEFYGLGNSAFVAQFFRNANFAITLSQSRVGLIEMGDADFATAPSSRQIANYNLQRSSYSLQSLIGKHGFGEKVVTLFSRQLAGLPAAVASTGFPLYFWCGDSIGVGPIPPEYMANTASLTLIGPGPGTVKPIGEFIYNKLNNQFERFNPNTNSNTSGTVSNKAGPEVPIFAALAQQHPDGFGLVKHASNGSGLMTGAASYNPADGSGGRWDKSANEHYTFFLQLMKAAKDYINQVYGKQADVRGGGFSIGHNDSVSAEAGALFATNLPAFINNFIADHSTRTSGRHFPIAFRKPQIAAAFNVQGMNLIIGAFNQLVKADSQIRLVDVDDNERDRNDDLHETPESAITTGRRIATAIISSSI